MQVYTRVQRNFDIEWFYCPSVGRVHFGRKDLTRGPKTKVWEIEVVLMSKCHFLCQILLVPTEANTLLNLHYLKYHMFDVIGSLSLWGKVQVSKSTTK